MCAKVAIVSQNHTQNERRALEDGQVAAAGNREHWKANPTCKNVSEAKEENQRTEHEATVTQADSKKGAETRRRRNSDKENNGRWCLCFCLGQIIYIYIYMRVVAVCLLFCIFCAVPSRPLSVAHRPCREAQCVSAPKSTVCQATSVCVHYMVSLCCHWLAVACRPSIVACLRSMRCYVCFWE